jgi:hypothetical protein
MTTPHVLSSTQCLPLAYTDFGRQVYVVGAAQAGLDVGTLPDALTLDGVLLDDATTLYNRRGARCGCMYTAYPYRTMVTVIA